MKALVFGDIHVHNYATFNNKENRRLENTLKAIRYIFKHADKVGAEYILFVGDLYNQQGFLPTLVVNRTVETFKTLFDRYKNIKLVAITGNHDLASKQVKGKKAVSALGHLDSLFENFKLIDNKVYSIEVEKGCFTEIHGIPYFDYSEHFSQVLDSCKICNLQGSKNILLTHQMSTDFGNSMINTDIDFTDDRFKQFDMVFNGHVHLHQELAKNFINVGSPLPRDVDDIGVDKGFIEFDLENPKNWEFISLTNLFPQIIIKTVGEELTAWDKLQYIKEIPAVIEDIEEEIKFEDYSSNKKPSEILTNYCNDTDNRDKLNIGLKLLSI